MPKRLIWLVTAGLVLAVLLVSCNSRPATPTVTPFSKITVGTDASWPPFSTLDKVTEKFKGFEIDVMEASAARQRLEVTWANQPYDVLLTNMTKGKYDAVIASVVITDELKKDLLFSDPYFTAGQIIVVRKDNFSITGKDNLKGNVGVVKGSNGAMEAAKLKDVQPVAYEKIEDALANLTAGKIDAVVCENSAAVVFVGRNPERYKTAGGVFTDENWGIAIGKDNTALQAKINVGLAAIKSDGLIDRFAQQWFK